MFLYRQSFQRSTETQTKLEIPSILIILRSHILTQSKSYSNYLPDLDPLKLLPTISIQIYEEHNIQYETFMSC